MLTKSAELSSDDVYRYTLERWWDFDIPPVLFIGMNPSTADAEHDDPTIRRCIRFARDWGYGGLLMGNLFAFRATDPKMLPGLDDSPLVSPIGENGTWKQGVYESVNVKHLRRMAERSSLIVAAWGSIKLPYGWDPRGSVRSALPPMHALGFTKEGHPRHPLYVKANVCPIPMSKVDKE